MPGRIRRTGGASCGWSSRFCTRGLCEALELRRLLSAGDLDPTFGGDGRVEAGFGQQGGSGDLLVAPDGKLLSFRNQAGRTDTWVTIYRMNPDGSPD